MIVCFCEVEEIKKWHLSFPCYSSFLPYLGSGMHFQLYARNLSLETHLG